MPTDVPRQRYAQVDMHNLYSNVPQETHRLPVGKRVSTLLGMRYIGGWAGPFQGGAGGQWARPCGGRDIPWDVVRLTHTAEVTGWGDWTSDRALCGLRTLCLSGPHLPLLPIDPISSTWGCCLPLGPCSQDHTSRSLPLCLSPQCLAPFIHQRLVWWSPSWLVSPSGATHFCVLSAPSRTPNLVVLDKGDVFASGSLIS